MFSFFKRKKSSDDKITESAPPSDATESAITPENEQPKSPDDTQTETVSSVAADEDVATALAPAEKESVGHEGDLPVNIVPPDDAVQQESDAFEPAQVPPARQDEVVSGTDEPFVSDRDESSGPDGLPETQDTVTSNDPEPVTKADEPKGSWFSRLKKGLSRTGQSIGGLFVDVKLDEDLYEELETALIMADAGMEATTKLLDELRTRVRKDRLTDAMQARAALRDILTEHLKPLEKTFPIGTVKPLVMMIAGVNGAGKTTSIGKLANTFQKGGAHVLLAAGDTFRAAAREQLLEWGNRNNVTVIAQEGGDPAAVAFDAVNAGRARQADVVMIDTAGRLPTQLHLMEELKKIKRVVTKADGNAPHEVLLVVDGNSGQNVIAQIRAFDAAIGLTGLVVTKLDGTAKGGILAAVAAGSQGVRPVPVYWIGVGEGIHDLQPFAAHEFSAALIGDAGHASK